MRYPLCRYIPALALLVTAASVAAPSDVVDGPLIRSAVSASDSRDLSGVWYIRLYNRQINSTLGRLPPAGPFLFRQGSYL